MTSSVTTTVAPAVTAETTHSNNNTSSTDITTGNSNITTVAGKRQCGVVESDTDTMSCCDDDSSPDQYHPTGSHHCRGVVDNSVGKCRASPQDGGVANTRTCQSVNSNSNNFPNEGIGITSDDDAELDRIFASVEVCRDLYYMSSLVILIDDHQ